MLKLRLTRPLFLLNPVRAFFQYRIAAARLRIDMFAMAVFSGF